MPIFPKPADLSGGQLRAELAASGQPVSVHDMVLIGEELHLHGVTDEGVAGPVVAAHVADPAWTATREEATARTVEDRLNTALDQLRTFVAATKPGTTAAQASAAYDAARLLARIAIGLIRLRLRRLDGTD